MHMRKPLALLVLGTIAVVAGCGSNAQNQIQNTKQPQSGNVELTYMTFTYEESTSEKDLIAQFESANPTIKIKLVTKPTNEFENQMILAHKANQAPDVFEARPGYTSSLGLLGIMADLTPLVEKEGAAYKSQFLPSAYDMGAWKGKQYAIPWRFGSWANFVNSDLLKAKNVTLPETWSFEEFAKLAQALTDPAKGTYGYAFAGAKSDLGTAQTWSSFLFANGGTLIKDSKPAFNDQAGVDTLQFWVDLVYKYKVTPPNPTSLTYKDVTDAYGQGKVAMWSNGPWYIATVKKAYPNIPIAIAPMPHGTSEGTATSGTLMAISPQSKHQAEAWTFLKFMVDAPAQTKWAEAAQYVPAHKEVLKAPFMNQPPLKVFGDMAGLKNSQQVGNLPEANALFENLNDAIAKALLKQATPKQALDEAAAKWEGVLAKYR